jgi:hypothetical protein
MRLPAYYNLGDFMRVRAGKNHMLVHDGVAIAGGLFSFMAKFCMAKFWTLPV